MNTYLIIGGIALVFICYLFILKQMSKKRMQAQLDEFSSRGSNLPLTEDQKRLLCFGGILFYHRDEKILNIMPDSNLDVIKAGLANQWDISNSAEAKETLNHLLQLRKSSEFEPMLLQSSQEMDTMRKDIAKRLEVDRTLVEQVQTAYAWDTCRATSLAKWCYWVGYLTETETWEFLRRTAQIASNKGQNWTEYTISFLLGRTIQGFELDDIDIECRTLIRGKGGSLEKVEDLDIYSRYNFK